MIRFCYTNYADAAVVSASSEVATLPAANVQSMWRSKPWRSTGCVSEWIKFDLGAARNILAVILTGHNLTSAATVHVQANASDAWTAPSVDVVIPWSARDLVYLWTASQSFRWWRFTFVDAANPDGHIDVGRAYVGLAPAPERQFSAHSRQLVDPTVISPSTDGAETFDDKAPYNVYTFGWSNVLPDEMENLVKAVGLKAYFWIIGDYDNAVETDGRHDLTAYVRFEDLPQYDYVYMTRRAVAMNLREAL